MLATRSHSWRTQAVDVDWMLTVDGSESPAELAREMNRRLLELRGEMERRCSELEVRLSHVRAEQTQWAVTVGMCVWVAAAFWIIVTMVGEAPAQRRASTRRAGAEQFAGGV